MNKNIKLKVFCTDVNPELSSACQVADLSFKAPRVTSNEYITFLKNPNSAIGVGFLSKFEIIDNQKIDIDRF